MLHRKIYQLCEAKSDVWIYLRDQGRWLERAKILDIEGDVVTIRYETEDDEEVCSWEEMVRLESIGAVTQRLSSFTKAGMSSNDIPVSDDCPEAEQIRPRTEPEK
ncbi:MAG: hypothetical protein DCE90_13535 [Pseudanabaena sp.]|nr:MAG: hypothetical protein DCE90_13535 [Pseudanabaena sp.]